MNALNGKDAVTAHALDMLSQGSFYKTAAICISHTQTVSTRLIMSDESVKLSTLLL